MLMSVSPFTSFALDYTLNPETRGSHKQEPSRRFVLIRLRLTLKSNKVGQASEHQKWKN